MRTAGVQKIDGANTSGSIKPHNRVAWVDYAKGICIIMVVLMWSTTDYGYSVGQEGWMHHVAVFAQPFRMPDFFLISGLFLAASIHAPWRDYLDRKLIHFAYFYLLWLTIQLVITETGMLLADPSSFAATWLKALIVPINSLWFVHLLAVFFLATRALRNSSPPLVFTLAALLHVAFHLGLLETGWNVANHFFDRYIFFYTGYVAAPWIFAFARRVAAAPRTAVGGVAAWAGINGLLTAGGHAAYPGVTLVLGFAGAGAIIAIASLLADRSRVRWLAYAGACSIVIYLSAFLPMKLMLKFLLVTGAVTDVGLACMVITVFAVAAPLVFHRAIQGTVLQYLYIRPGFVSLPTQPLADTRHRPPAGALR